LTIELIPRRRLAPLTWNHSMHISACAPQGYDPPCARLS
jgi:hypothetical protein